MILRKSPYKGISDSKYSALPVSHRALFQARSHVGEREIGGNNRGPFVSAILKWIGVPIGSPWCATFVSKCLVDAGFPKKELPKGAAAVQNWVKLARKHGAIKGIGSRGDLIYRLQPNGKGHIGFITSTGAQWYTTIEGNTDAGDGSRDGDGVYDRRRPVIGVWKAIDIQKIADELGIP